jgi:cytochrome c biogenesis protein CcdA
MFGVSGLLIERSRRADGSRFKVGLTYATWSVVWIAAHVIGGGIVGAVLGTLGGRLPLPRHGFVAYALGITLGLAGLHNLGVLRLPMPQIQRQVPRVWLVRFPLVWIAVGYGVQLGAGVTTRITNFATYATLVAAILTRNAAEGALIMAAFGTARALPAVFVGPFVGTPQRSLAAALAVEEWEERVHRASGALLLVGAFLVAVFIGAI